MSVSRTPCLALGHRDATAVCIFFSASSARFRSQGVRNPYESAASELGVPVGNISRWMKARACF